MFSLLAAAALALLVLGLVRGDQPATVGGALLTLSMGINLVTQLRRRP